MNIPQLCIQRPVMTVLLCVSCVLAGWLAYLKLPVAALPSYNTPVISVTAQFPGASPETMAAAITVSHDQAAVASDAVNESRYTSLLKACMMTMPSR